MGLGGIGDASGDAAAGGDMEHGKYVLKWKPEGSSQELEDRFVLPGVAPGEHYALKYANGEHNEAEKDPKSHHVYWVFKKEPKSGKAAGGAEGGKASAGKTSTRRRRSVRYMY